MIKDFAHPPYLPAILLSMAVTCVPTVASSGETDPYASKRSEMVRDDIQRRGISSPEVIRALSSVPRHLFVPEELRRQAYWDTPLPIGHGQTISQPYVVALMSDALQLEGGEKVLEIGTGSGYQAAVLAEIVEEVFSVEIIPQLADRARRTLEERGYGSVEVKSGDGYYGWAEKGPFDAIIITAAANHIPPSLLDQLKEGGRLILPLGRTTHVQVLTVVTKKKDRLETFQMGGVRFVPMVGEAQKPSPATEAPR